MVYITRKMHFNAAHKMANPAWSKAKNEEVFGPCANENWHGHNYELEVTLAGDPDPETGYVYDLGKLKQLIEKQVVSKVDHRNLNLDVDFLKGIMPSTENFVVAIWHQLAAHVAPARLHAVKLYETERNSAEYRGE